MSWPVNSLLNSSEAIEPLEVNLGPLPQHEAFPVHLLQAEP